MDDLLQLPPGKISRAIDALKSIEPSRKLLEGVERESGYEAGVRKLRTLWKKHKPKMLEKASEDPRHPHFAKLAEMLGRTTTSGMPSGVLSSATAPAQPFDAPRMPQPTGAGRNTTPPRPKEPGMSVKKQAINPRLRLADAMNKGMA